MLQDLQHSIKASCEDVRQIPARVCAESSASWSSSTIAPALLELTTEKRMFQKPKPTAAVKWRTSTNHCCLSKSPSVVPVKQGLAPFPSTCRDAVRYNDLFETQSSSVYAHLWLLQLPCGAGRRWRAAPVPTGLLVSKIAAHKQRLLTGGFELCSCGATRRTLLQQSLC